MTDLFAGGAPVVSVPQASLLPFLSRGPLRDEVELALRRYILGRRMRPGDRLPSEGDLATTLGTSRVVVREALRSLEAVGLLESRSGSGRYLSAFSTDTAARTLASALAFHPAALIDLLSVRRAIEAEAVLLAARHASNEDLDALDGYVRQMRVRLAGGATNFPVEDHAFHRRIVVASGNQVALALVDLFWEVMDAVYTAGFPGPTTRSAPDVVEAHASLAAALRKRSGAKAQRALRAHLQEAEQRFTAWQGAHAGQAASLQLLAVDDAIQAALLGLALRAA